MLPKGTRYIRFTSETSICRRRRRLSRARSKLSRTARPDIAQRPGIPQLREALAADIHATHGIDYRMENIAVQPGGKPTIGKFILALMNPGDEVLYPNPGYPIYESQIEFNGGVAVPYTYSEGETNFVFDIDAIRQKITPRTKILILNDLQNPMGAECSLADLEGLAELAIENNLMVLSDEAYFEIRYEGKSRSIASLPGMAERTVLLYSCSKKFSMSGWRLGATIGPKEIIDVIAKLNVNDESCTNHFIQYGAIAGLTGDQTEVREHPDCPQRRRDAAAEILNTIPGVRCFRPNATFYLFPQRHRADAEQGLHRLRSVSQGCAA